MSSRNSTPETGKNLPSKDAALQLHELTQQLTAIDAVPVTHQLDPIEHWNPDFCGTMDLHILSNGDWIHEGRKVTRQALVKLFARVLWREQTEFSDHYFLKTPVEKIEIQVEDAPLLITQIDFTVSNHTNHPLICCTTNTDDQFNLDSQHPIYMRAFRGEMRPYVLVRRNIEALVHRNAFFHLIAQGEMITHGTTTTLVVYSGNTRFELASDPSDT